MTYRGAVHPATRAHGVHFSLSLVVPIALVKRARLGTLAPLTRLSDALSTLPVEIAFAVGVLACRRLRWTFGEAHHGAIRRLAGRADPDRAQPHRCRDRRLLPRGNRKGANSRGARRARLSHGGRNLGRRSAAVVTRGQRGAVDSGANRGELGRTAGRRRRALSAHCGSAAPTRWTVHP